MSDPNPNPNPNRLSNRHFQQGSQGESASKRPTLLAAAQEAGLDAQTVTAFLDSDELHDEVLYVSLSWNWVAVKVCRCCSTAPGVPSKTLPFDFKG